MQVFWVERLIQGTFSYFISVYNMFSCDKLWFAIVNMKCIVTEKFLFVNNVYVHYQLQETDRTFLPYSERIILKELRAPKENLQ